MAKKLSRAVETTTTTGTGNITLAGARSADVRSLSDAGAVNGDVLELVIEDANGNREYGEYPYNSGVLTRSGSVRWSTNSNSPINLSGDAIVYSDFLAESILGNTKISPSQLTANQNDWDPADATSGSKTGTVIDFTTDASRNITGLKASQDGDIRILRNRGSNNAVFQDEGTSTSSTAANRFQFGSDITVAPKQSLVIEYDGASARWKQIGGSAIRKSGVTAGSYGSASSIPTIVVGEDGRVTSASGNTVSQTRVYLGRTTISAGASTADFIALDTTTYKLFEFRIGGLQHQDTSQADTFEMLFGTGGTPTWDTTKANYASALNGGTLDNPSAYQGCGLSSMTYSATALGSINVILQYIESTTFIKPIRTSGLFYRANGCSTDYFPATMVLGTNNLPISMWKSMSAATSVRFQFTRSSAVKTFAGGFIDLYAEKLA